jgi:hypothetical protein
MSKKCNAVLIDPYKEEITDIVYDSSDYRNIYPLIHCDCFTIVKLGDEDDVFVDDEGLLKVTPDTKFFKLNDFQQPLAGYGLIVGADEETGETVPVHHNADYYRSKIQFLDVEMLRVFGYFE